MSRDKRKPEIDDLISGDRRSDRRYGLQLDVKWKLIRRRRVLETGVGTTIDLSSGGIMFNAGRHLPVGLNVELSIAWPVLLHNTAPLQLVVSGKIVRVQGSQIAIRTVQHEFRTQGIAQDHQGPASPPSQILPMLTSAAALASLGKML